MTQEPFFDFNPTPDPDAWSFWVRVKTTDFDSKLMPEARVTKFRDFKLKVEGAAILEGSSNTAKFADHYFIEATSAATPQYFRFYFAASSTSRSLVGKSYQTEAALPPSQFLIGKTVQTTSQIVPYGTAPSSSSGVIDSNVEPVNGIISRINTNVLLSYDGTPLYSWVMDQDTGKGYQVKEEVVPAGTVGSSEVAADGTFASVQPVNASFSIKTTKKTTTLSNVPRTWTKTERSPVLWPTVLLSLEPLAILDAGGDYWHKRYTGMLMPSYTGDIIVDYAEWWQKSAPAALTPTEMVPTKVSIKREWSEDVIVEACLHPQIVVKEVVVVGRYPWTGYPDTGLRTVNYTVPATNVLTWPDTVVKMDVDPFQGGYRCLKRTIHKPNVTQEGITITITPFVPEHYVFTNYP